MCIEYINATFGGKLFQSKNTGKHYMFISMGYVGCEYKYTFLADNARFVYFDDYSIFNDFFPI